jgi:hypothetical protein
MSLTGWAIGWNEGLQIREHPNGFRVAERKKEKGKWFNQLGREVSEQIAKEAGFDVEASRKERLKRERLADAMQAIEQDLAVEPTGEEVIGEKGGFKAVHIGLGRHVVRDSDGNQLTPTPLTREQAELLLAKLTERTGRQWLRRNSILVTSPATRMCHGRTLRTRRTRRRWPRGSVPCASISTACRRRRRRKASTCPSGTPTLRPTTSISARRHVAACPIASSRREYERQM